MRPKSRLFIWVLSFLILSGVNFSKVHAAGWDTFFVATAYYSPLPNQITYATGTYAGDIRLNGEWHTTASWNNVFPGLLAWPANYPFGTKIYFKWYWIWVIEDRWWAIVKAWERGYSYDRIDIWMWYGDEWLARAKRWWKRTIKGKIVVPSSEITISFWESQIWSLTKLTVNPENADSDAVKQVQTIFTKADLYSWEIDWNYESIKNEIIDFQISTGIILSRDEESAGWYGPKTIAALRERYGNSSDNLVEEPIEKFAAFNHGLASEKYKLILEYGNLKVDPDSDADEISQLQDLLTKLWEYSGKIDGRYSSIEIALLDLQKRIGLIDNIDSWGAWYFGNKTKSALWTYYENVDQWIDRSHIYSLSWEEKLKLSTAFQKLQSSKSETYVQTLLIQINKILPRYENNPSVKAKILYLQQIAQ
jgi:hypothetical protein